MNLRWPAFLQNANGILCAVRSLGILGAIEMGVKFWHSSSADYQGFGAGIALMMGAIVAQHWVESDSKGSQ